LSSRSGNWITPRTTFFGVATDQLQTRAVQTIPKTILNFVFESLIKLHLGDLAHYNLKPAHKVLESPAVVGGTILDQIECGKVKVVKDIERVYANSVKFINGECYDIDSIILCTGYKVEVPFIDQTEIYGKDKDSDRIKLYKHIFPNNVDNLAFIGIVQASGSVLPISEMQARWACKVFKGEYKLPSFKERRDITDIDWREHLKQYIPRSRTSVAVDQNEYMDYIASEIRCKPDFWALFTEDPLLCAKVIFGPFISAQYRLNGPGNCPEASDIIHNICKGFDLRRAAFNIMSKVPSSP
jgi:dimethylaniline monooxygenase (N-oxide forming)